MTPEEKALVNALLISNQGFRLIEDECGVGRTLQLYKGELFLNGKMFEPDFIVLLDASIKIVFTNGYSVKFRSI